MRKRLIATTATIVVLGLTSAPFAVAQDVSSGTSTVAATVAAGVRSIVVDKAALTLTGTRSAMTDTYNIGVTEVARNGTNPWRVQASFAANALTGSTSGVNIPNSSLSISGRTQTLGTYTAGDTTGVATGTLGTEGAFSAARDLLVVSGQNLNSAYTTATAHDATGTITLAVPADAPSDAYAGTLTFTLLNT